MKRRTFLKLAGAGSLTFAAGCTGNPENTLFSMVRAPDDMVTGKAGWYASTCRQCPAGCGVIAKNREGRVVKIEGNPLHPVNRGTLCMRGQAALQGIYNPDRVIRPLLKTGDRWQPVSYEQALALVAEKAEDAARQGKNGVRVLTETPGDPLFALFTAALEQWRSEGPTVFEPFAYESLKAANARIFGVAGLPGYRLDLADVLVGFGADFLETWLSPVAYAGRFSRMHAAGADGKGWFFHVSPYQSLTGANADLWVSCRPGAEAAVALGLIGEALADGRGGELGADVRNAAASVSAPFSRERVLATSGVAPAHYDLLVKRLLAAASPLVLGTGAASAGPGAFAADVAVNLLHLVLAPDLPLMDWDARHRVEMADSRSGIAEFFTTLAGGGTRLLLLNNVDPVYHLPPGSGVRKALAEKDLFVVSFSSFMNDTDQLADLVFPVALPLETWDEYGGLGGAFASMLQPAMGRWVDVPVLGDVVLGAAFGGKGPAPDYTSYLFQRLSGAGFVATERDWLDALQKGGVFHRATRRRSAPAEAALWSGLGDVFAEIPKPEVSELSLTAVPSIRFFDGRDANKPWVCEVPDPLTQVAWQTPVLAHPDTLAANRLHQGDVVRLGTAQGSLEVPVYAYEGVRPGVLAMAVGQGHRSYGRYAENTGTSPLGLMPSSTDAAGGPVRTVAGVILEKTGRTLALARTDGSRIQHGRKIALSVTLEGLAHPEDHGGPGLTMDTFPLTLPLPEGYDPKRDIYPPHDHVDYRWGMVVDLDRCIGCGACAVACYAENNVGVVGVEQILKGREMAWLRVERYHDPDRMEKITFLPMMCQHCDAAPCESVCPVYAPHHSKEGLNNQIYNRCIGTRFCSQNCPYKVRRFNWFQWPWPKPLDLQLNPDVTVRSKGVMEKCSFCIQRIKEAHNRAKNENRRIRDGEVVPACVQTCPTRALTFGSLMDPDSRVRRLADDRRAYQVMGYLNTKPAVIYLKKVVHDI